MAMAGCPAGTSSYIVGSAVTLSQAASSSSSSSLESSRRGLLPLSSSFVELSPLRSGSLSSSSSPWSSFPSHFCRKGRCGALPARMMLPSQYPDRVSSVEQRPKIDRWSARAIKSFSMAELEARKLKYPTTGTEALIMGMLTEGTSQAARYLRAHGITLFKVRDETVRLLGKADMYFFSPEHPPLTEPAQKALDWAVDVQKKSGVKGEVTTTHLLLGIWAQKGSAGQQVLAALGFGDKNVQDLEETLKQPALQA